MVVKWMTVGLILLCHATAFVAIYAGRVNGAALCGSDVTLFVVPLVVAGLAYATVFLRVIKTRTLFSRVLLAMVAGLVVGIVSAGIGMLIAFNLWGT